MPESKSLKSQFLILNRMKNLDLVFREKLKLISLFFFPVFIAVVMFAHYFALSKSEKLLCGVGFGIYFAGLLAVVYKKYLWKDWVEICEFRAVKPLPAIFGFALPTGKAPVTPIQNPSESSNDLDLYEGDKMFLINNLAFNASGLMVSALLLLISAFLTSLGVSSLILISASLIISCLAISAYYQFMKPKVYLVNMKNGDGSLTFPN